MNRFAAIVLAAWSLLLPAGAQDSAAPAPAAPDVPVSPFRADAEALLAAPHRLSGTEEYAAAADYVEARLREIGIETVVVQEFPSLQTDVHRCELTAGDRTIPLVPGRPDAVLPPVSPPEGITGELVDVGDGSDE